MSSSRTNGKTLSPESYRHPTADTPLHPDVGSQAQYRKKYAPKKYRYDSSLSPALEWDGQNPARKQGEELLEQIEQAETLEEAKEAARKLKALGNPFLDWAGKAERLSFDVPTLPLFVHERLSTQNIIETLKSHKPQLDMMEMFAHPTHTIADQVLRSYEHGPRSIRDPWVNRLILGDSLVVMNSLLHLDNLGGQVQMIYMDPPYGVKFSSNFQPFVRKRDVAHGDDEAMTREPEMVQAYRDTWELNVHSYLTYLRDRFLLSRDLLTPTGSLFVQIGEDNLHHVREVLDEVFGEENSVVIFPVKKKGSQKGRLIDPVNDYLLWYAKDIVRVKEKFHQLYIRAEMDAELAQTFRYVELPDGRELTLTQLSKSCANNVDYAQQPELILRDFPGAKIFKSENITSGGYPRTQSVIYNYKGRTFDPGITRGNCWKHSAITDDDSRSGMDKLADAKRLYIGTGQLGFKRYTSDFGYKALSNWWDELGGASDPVYVVQTNTEIVKRCILMTTDPGDLVIDPTCGSGTTAYVAEKWGRRWITIDTSRVPLALARQRLLTATFPFYELADNTRGPVSGFVYKRKKNRRGEEIGGIVPHITSSTIANDEQPIEEILVDRPEEIKGVTRITGPFRVEGTVPAPYEWEKQEGVGQAASPDTSPFAERMLEILRRSPVLRLSNNETVTFRNIRPPVRTLALSAEALVDVSAPGQTPTLHDIADEADEKNGHRLALTARPVAFAFGPENGAVSEKLVYEAAREAEAKHYTHLYVIGFAIQPNARALIENCAEVFNVPATYVQATPDLMMDGLLQHSRSSQIFSVCGLPEIKVHKIKDGLCQVELIGLDVFDPITLDVKHEKGDNVPAWFLDINYDGQCFYVSQAFFPRTSAWDNLKKAIGGIYDASVWDHLAGTVSAPFEPGKHCAIAVKVIDDRGNELLVEKRLEDRA